MDKVLLVIPAYNEQDNIERVVNQLIQDYPEYDYVIIDDASTDKTSKICKDNGYNVIRLPINTGLGVVVQTGFKYALRNHYDYVIQFDGDGQHDPQYIRDLIQKAKEGYNIVFGSRFIQTNRGFTLREIGSRLISFAFKITTGKKISDPTSGFKCYDQMAIEYYALQDHAIPETDDIVYLVKKRGYRIAEVPVTMHCRVAGESYFSPFKSIRFMINILLSILLLQNFRKK